MGAFVPGASGDRAGRGGMVEFVVGGVDRGLRRDDVEIEDSLVTRAAS